MVTSRTLGHSLSHLALGMHLGLVNLMLSTTASIRITDAATAGQVRQGPLEQMGPPYGDLGV